MESCIWSGGFEGTRQKHVRNQRRKLCGLASTLKISSSSSLVSLNNFSYPPASIHCVSLFPSALLLLAVVDLGLCFVCSIHKKKSLLLLFLWNIYSQLDDNLKDLKHQNQNVLSISLKISSLLLFLSSTSVSLSFTFSHFECLSFHISIHLLYE